MGAMSWALMISMGLLLVLGAARKDYRTCDQATPQTMWLPVHPGWGHHFSMPLPSSLPPPVLNPEPLMYWLTVTGGQWSSTERTGMSRSLAIHTDRMRRT